MTLDEILKSLNLGLRSVDETGRPVLEENDEAEREQNEKNEPDKGRDNFHGMISGVI